MPFSVCVCDEKDIGHRETIRMLAHLGAAAVNKSDDNETKQQSSRCHRCVVVGAVGAVVVDGRSKLN